jgi:hypothetical protein
LTIIGSDDERKAVTDDLNKHPLLSPLASNLLVRDYRPDHWHVARAGFVTAGHPSIYLQATDGKVLHRTAVYEGPEKLAEAIRKADPHYDPSKDPDLNKIKPGGSSPVHHQLPLFVLGGAFLLYLCTRKKT